MEEGLRVVRGVDVCINVWDKIPHVIWTSADRVVQMGLIVKPASDPDIVYDTRIVLGPGIDFSVSSQGRLDGSVGAAVQRIWTAWTGLDKTLVIIADHVDTINM